jgi:hypothetical protein
MLKASDEKHSQGNENSNKAAEFCCLLNRNENSFIKPSSELSIIIRFELCEFNARNSKTFPLLESNLNAKRIEEIRKQSRVVIELDN